LLNAAAVTWGTALWAGLVTFAGLSAAVAWALVLRRRLRIQAERLRSQYEREAALEREYRDFFENALDAIYTHDLEGRLMSFNKAAERLTGFSREEALAAGLDSLVVPDDVPQWRSAIQRGIGGEWVPAYVLELRTRGTGRVFVEVNSRLRYEPGRPTTVQSIARDVTERRHLEEQLRHSQRLEAVGRLAGGVAHDFNNIISVITGYGEILARDLADNEVLRPKVDQVVKAAARAAGLTQQLLAFSRNQPQELKILDLNAVVSGVETMIARLIGEQIQLVTRPAPEPVTVRADSGQLEQVVMNLAVNARDAMVGDGTLTIETSNVELDEAFRAAHSGAPVGRYVRLRVSDTGCGMDAETRLRLFEPFFTTKERGKGTGLGLATVYGIVQQSEGYITVDSEPGHGAAFTIYLPRVEAAVEEPAPAGRPERLAGSETILLVEDDEVLRTCGRFMLEAEGYRVLEACDGEHALEVAAQYQGPIHVAVTDVVMPRLNGRDLAMRLAPSRPDTKILYMSGYAERMIDADALEPSREAFIAKPFTASALCLQIRVLLKTA
jgi:two-component system, cell cycle sensor histidine kinase and response regulator CckA